MEYLERTAEQKKIVWLEAGNRYLLLEMPAYEVFRKLADGIHQADVADWFREFYHLSGSRAAKFVKEVDEITRVKIHKPSLQPDIYPSNQTIPIPEKFFTSRFYQIAETLFSVSFENENLEQLIHPKFSHLEVLGMNHLCENYLCIFHNGDLNVLTVNNKFIGQWPSSEDYYLSGKFSLELINKLYQKQESEWMATLHASAIFKERECILFLGPSGNGKSTLTAILMAHGFELLADDFVPVDTSGEAFFYPAAVSIKKTVIDDLIPLFPQLSSANEFNYPEKGKTIRYLPPKENKTAHYPCKALVFVEYKKNHAFEFIQLPKDKAFQQLIPDSWISPLAKNADCFLDWFLEKPCYLLTYSDNEKMVETVHKLFNNDL